MKVVFCFSFLLSFSLASNESTIAADVVRNLALNEQSKNEFEYKREPKCKLVLEHPAQAKIVQNLLKIDKLNLIQYNLRFVNHSTSPLKFNDSINPHKWYRSASGQGLILLSLPFNHDLLSLKTLSLGTTKLNIDLIDKTPNCMKLASSEEQIYSIQYMLIRDFTKTSVEFKWKEGICRKILKMHNKVAEFLHECIVTGEEGLEKEIVTGESNFWLNVLNILLMVVRVVALAYIPCVVISIFKGLIKRKVPYIVKLKPDTFIRKRIIITDNEDIRKEYARNKKEVLDLNDIHGFPHLRNFLKNNTYPLDEVFSVRFNRYDILVDYHRTVTEDQVKVGLIHTIIDLIFRCKIKHLGPFVQCCHADLNKFFCQQACRLPWITFFRKFSSFVLILLIPFPYYVRLVVYYMSGEQEQIQARKEFASKFDLSDAFANSLVLFMTPTHPILIIFYVIYVITGCIVSLTPKKNCKTDRHQVLRRLVNSFRDLDEFSVVRVVGYVVSIITWPFYKFGILGCFIAPFYWALAFPLTLFVCLIYSIPSFYLINRMIYYCRKAVCGRLKNEPTQPLKYQVHHSMSQKKLLQKLKVERYIVDYKHEMLSKMHTDHQEPLESITSNPMFEGIAKQLASSKDPPSKESVVKEEEEEEEDERVSCLDACLYIGTTVLCIITFCGIAFIAADLVVFVVECIVFTIMGIIVNAGYVLRHVLVAAIVLLYCVDNFFILEKKYLKMNKVIFAEVSKRVTDLDKVTSLPSFLQENRGFKAQECMEQADYENSDSVVPLRHWMINDLVLFMDSEDTPRVPVRLFNKVCSIHVPGVPGPVYRGQIDALKQLSKVLFMVFMVVIAVMVFGEVYSISSTNQLIATVAGSFIPLLFRSFIFKQEASVEVSTLTFKCHLDELIERFHQNWPIFDLIFHPDDDSNLPGVSSNDESFTSQHNNNQYADFVIGLPRGFKRQSHV